MEYTDYLPVVVVFMLVVLVIGFTYARSPADRWAKHFRLEEGERVVGWWPGEVETAISSAEQAATVAMGLVAGALLGGIGVTYLRALGVTALTTTHGRLLFVVERPDGKANRLFLRSPRDARVEVLGVGAKRMQGGASVVVGITGADGATLRCVFQASIAEAIEAWRRAAPVEEGATELDFLPQSARSLAIALEEAKSFGGPVTIVGNSASGYEAVPHGGARWTDFRAPVVPGWTLLPEADRGPEDGLQAACDAPDVAVRGTLYVYNKGLRGLRRDDETLRREMAEVARGVEMATAQGSYQASRPLGPPGPVEAGGARWMRQQFSVTHGGRELLSEAWLTTHKGFLVKLRLTYEGLAGPPAFTRVGALVTALGAASHDA